MDAASVIWLVKYVGLPMAENLIEIWSEKGKDPFEEIKRLRDEGLPDFRDFRKGTNLEKDDE